LLFAEDQAERVDNEELDMTSDEKLVPTLDGTERPVGFIGGPYAGQARMIPRGEDVIQDAQTAAVYRIWPFRAKNNPNKVLWLAFENGRDPLDMVRAMWEEYSISAQIRGGDHGYLRRLGKDITSRT
jgi:hypothetical protein